MRPLVSTLVSTGSTRKYANSRTTMCMSGGVDVEKEEQKPNGERRKKLKVSVKWTEDRCFPTHNDRDGTLAGVNNTIAKQMLYNWGRTNTRTLL